jgi:5-methylcytosine-specific restriction endonuclease McrA
MNKNSYKYNQYQLRYSLDNYQCQRCGNPSNQIAHRISQSKMFLKKYGDKIINHHYNLVSVCCLECNDYYNIGQNIQEEKKLVEKIKKDIKSKKK